MKEIFENLKKREIMEKGEVIMRGFEIECEEQIMREVERV